MAVTRVIVSNFCAVGDGSDKGNVGKVDKIIILVP